MSPWGAYILGFTNFTADGCIIFPTWIDMQPVEIYTHMLLVQAMSR